MKVLIANKFFFKNGGSEVVMFQERDFLRQNGVQVVDFSMEHPRNEPSEFASYFVSSRVYAKGSIGQRIRAAVELVHSPEAIRNISTLIAREKPDLLHCHNIYHQLTPSIILTAKERGVPVVLTLHDSKPVCPTYLRLRHGKPCSDCLEGTVRNVVRHRCADGSLGKSFLLFAEAKIQRWIGSYDAVDLFIAPSQFLADSVTRHRFSRDRVCVLHNGVDTASIAPRHEDEGYILYLGRLSREKGVQTLLRAHDGISPACRLVVAGTGPLADALSRSYPKAEFVGHVTGEELDRLLAGAAAVVVPSEWYENCSMAILEAMAWGKPVVASRIGGNPELVLDGETGLLFEPGDDAGLRNAMTALLRDPQHRRNLGYAARRRAEQFFSLTRHNECLLEIYDSVISR